MLRITIWKTYCGMNTHLLIFLQNIMTKLFDKNTQMDLETNGFGKNDNLDISCGKNYNLHI